MIGVTVDLVIEQSVPVLTSTRSALRRRRRWRRRRYCCGRRWLGSGRRWCRCGGGDDAGEPDQGSAAVGAVLLQQTEPLIVAGAAMARRSGLCFVEQRRVADRRPD